MEKLIESMTERDLLIVLNERVLNMQKAFAEHNSKLVLLESDFTIFKTEMQTRFKTYTALATSIATVIGSILTYIVQHFIG